MFKATILSQPLILAWALSTIVLFLHSASAQTYPCPESFTIRECERQQKSYASILSLHHLLDANKDGGIDPKETNRFVSAELHQTVPSERIQRLYESDSHIKPQELWEVWTHNEAYNWTVYEVRDWLVQMVDLPQFEDVFLEYSVDGKSLPLLVEQSGDFLSNVLGIRSLVYRQKIMLKALDCILFGPPKPMKSFFKDVLFALLSVASSIAVGISYHKQKCWKNQMKRMGFELEQLASVENSMQELQKQLEDYQSGKSLARKRSCFTKKPSQLQITAFERNQQGGDDDEDDVADLRKQLGEARAEAQYLRSMLAEMEAANASSRSSPLRDNNNTSPTNSSNPSSYNSKLPQLTPNTAQNSALSTANSIAKSLCSLAGTEQQQQFLITSELRTWLQITYEVESAHYNAKKALAERSLRVAKEGCDRIKRKRQSLLGSLKLAHDASFEVVDKEICEAKHAMEAVSLDFVERRQRWSEIERLLGIGLVPTPGLRVLRSHLDQMRVQLHMAAASSCAILRKQSINDSLMDLGSQTTPIWDTYFEPPDEQLELDCSSSTSGMDKRQNNVSKK